MAPIIFNNCYLLTLYSFSPYIISIYTPDFIGFILGIFWIVLYETASIYLEYYVGFKAGEIHLGNNWGLMHTWTRTFLWNLFIYKESFNYLVLVLRKYTYLYINWNYMHIFY